VGRSWPALICAIHKIQCSNEGKRDRWGFTTVWERRENLFGGEYVENTDVERQEDNRKLTLKDIG